MNLGSICSLAYTTLKANACSRWTPCCIYNISSIDSPQKTRFIVNKGKEVRGPIQRNKFPPEFTQFSPAHKSVSACKKNYVRIFYILLCNTSISRPLTVSQMDTHYISKYQEGLPLFKWFSIFFSKHSRVHESIEIKGSLRIIFHA